MSVKLSSKRLFLFLALLAILASPMMAQVIKEKTVKEPVFFFAPSGDISLYGRNGPSAGGGFTIGTDGRVSLGLTGLYTIPIVNPDNKRVDVLETNIFVRVYIIGKKPCTGLFLQANAGPVFYSVESNWQIPAAGESVSAGLAIGWRFPIGNYFFIEPAVRGGYPYIVRAGVSAGVRL